MLSDRPTIGARFEINKIASGSYGEDCWKIFWRAISPAELPGALLWEGDTGASCHGQESVYCIAVQCADAEIVERVRSALLQNTEFKKVCSEPMFVDGARCTSEPLPDAGKVDSAGNLVGDAWNSRPALLAVTRERQSQHLTQKGASNGL
jgi:hypothetical protein